MYILHRKGKKKATVICIVPILSESTYHEPLQEQEPEKQLLCWESQKKEMQAWIGHQNLTQCLQTALS
jgi:hypothetical protein